jgi:alpha-tubulin suppressor-like RCC1 family protein
MGCSGDRASGRDPEVDEPPAEPSACEVAEQEQPARIESITARYETTCAVTNTGHMYCWGYSDMGIAGHPELGLTFCTARRAPAHRCIRQISMGKTLACGSTFDRRAVCWGAGIGPYPAEIVGLEDVVQMSAMDRAGAALLGDGTMHLWGDKLVPSGEPVLEPTELFPALDDVAGLQKGGWPLCAFDSAGRVICWGGATSEAVGEQFEPRVLPAVHDAIELSGISPACARSKLGTVWCWGTGPLGDGTGEGSYLEPVRVEGIDTGISVSTYLHACAALEDGAVVCWGDCTAGACGEGASGDVLTPHRVEGLPPAIQVSVGFWYTCALTVEREVYCWGHRVKCEPGTKVDTPIPQKVVFSDPIE